MRPEMDAHDWRLLYDAARGFLERREPEAQIRYALLSLTGATGASFATWLTRVGDELQPVESRGPTDSLRPLPITRKLENAFGGARAPLTGDSLRDLGAAATRWAERCGVEMVAPVLDGDRALEGVFALGPRMFGDPYSEPDVDLAAQIVALATVALTGGADPHRERRARSSARRIAALRERFPVLEEFRGEGPATAELFEELAGLAEFDLPVLVLGETGTGKELVARAIHEMGARREGSFEAINCAAIPPDLMASALFGHERGAFTGAVAKARGAFERAGPGTIFLDEIGDMPPATQASLLRVLQDGTFRRVGGETVLPAQARVVSATNRDLARAVENGTFRSDLFYRLQMFSVRIPPLRERREEIPVIAAHVLAELARKRSPAPVMSRRFLDEICCRELPGNVRELGSLIVGALVHAGSASTLLAEHLPTTTCPPEEVGDVGPAPAGGAPTSAEVPSYENMERQYIRSVLRLTDGNKKEAAELMGIPRTTLNARMKKLGIGAS